MKGFAMKKSRGQKTGDSADGQAKAQPDVSTTIDHPPHGNFGQNLPITIVGLGASAGGLEALEKFFANMPPDSDMAFIVVMHLDPSHKTMLPELLGRHTRMEIMLAEEGVVPQPNNVYIIPANKDLKLYKGQLHLEEPSQPRGARHTIDNFLRSLASAFGENSIAVILSGTGTDGTQGIKAIKEAGGFVVVQEEASAKYSGMPTSAIASGVVDLILPVEEMPEKIIELVNRSSNILTNGEGVPKKKIETSLHAIFRLVRTHSGQDFNHYKMSTVTRRIERRMAINNINSLENYVKFLKEKPEENTALFKEVLIGVTNFFRDPEAFETIQKKIIPQIFAGKGVDEPVRVWLAGCATGEEAYSMAILLREYMRENKIENKIQIFASDIDQGAIEFARNGTYPDSIATDVSPERLQTFFTKHNNSYQVVKSLREIIIFAHHNLLNDPPFSRLDLLVCRNLLIYLNPDAQKRLLPIFFHALLPDRYMFLGTSENIGTFIDLFETVDKKWKLFCRKAAGHNIDLKLPYFQPGRPSNEQEPTRQAPERDAIGAGTLAERMLLELYAPASVVINEKCEVVHFFSRTSVFLEQPVGKPTLDIFKMAREDLRPALRAGIHKVQSRQEPVVYRDVKINLDGKEVVINLRVEPVLHPASAKGLSLVMFEIVEEPAGGEKPVAGRSSSARRPRAKKDVDAFLQQKEQVIEQLEEQLRITHEELQGTIERVETSNEELKSSNEELMSMNEEFQSTNEELETSKEELQALNEELVTVNSELENKIAELDEANADMQNLFNSSDIHTIFLDRQLRIKRFTPQVEEVFHLIPSDVGRPLKHMSGKIDYPDLYKDAEKVLNKLKVNEREVSVSDGRHFLARVIPYRTGEGVIDGVIITLIDITERVGYEKKLREATQLAKKQKRQLEALLKAVPAAVWIAHDRDCNNITGNTAAYNLLRSSEGANVSKNNPEAQVGHFEIYHDGKLLKAEEMPMQKASSTGEAILGFEEEIVFSNGDRVPVFGNAVPLKDGDKTVGAVAAFIDISALKKTQDELREARDRAESANQAKSDFLANMSHEIRTPMTGILGYADLTLETELNPKQAEFLHMIKISGDTLLRLINNILDLSKIEAGKIELEEEVFSLGTVIDEVHKLFVHDAEKKGLKLTVEQTKGLPAHLFGDQHRLRQLLINLMANAIKFTEQGEIILKVAGMDREITEQKTVWLEFHVCDTGPGISQDKIDQIFKKFTQVDGSKSRKYKGTGLGLAICKQIVDKLGGSISVRSEQGKGSEFSLSLPFRLLDVKDNSETSDSAEKPTRVPKGNNRRLLLVEDEEINLKIIRTCLEQGGYQVTEAKDAKEALNILSGNTFDLILSDVQMPGLDGIELAKTIRTMETSGDLIARTPIIALTAHAAKEDRENCLAAGMDDHVSKPVQMKNLMKTIELLNTPERHLKLQKTK